MKRICEVLAVVLAVIAVGCITGDEITSFVIDPDGSMTFSIYRLNLTSTETGAAANEDLAKFIGDIENKRGQPFVNLEKGNAQDVNATILRKQAPASVLITGRIPSLDGFAAYFSESDNESSIRCTPLSRGLTRGFSVEFSRKPPKDKTEPKTVRARADGFSEMRFALAEGTFTGAQGFTLAGNKRSALLDMAALTKKLDDPRVTSIKISLEWQLPETVKK